MQFLSENRLNGCQIFGWFSKKPNPDQFFGFPQTANYCLCVCGLYVHNFRKFWFHLYCHCSILHDVLCKFVLVYNCSFLGFALMPNILVVIFLSVWSSCCNIVVIASVENYFVRSS